MAERRDHASPSPAPEQRRGFITKAIAAIVGAVAGLTPLAVGLFAFADPLRKRKRPNRGGPADPAQSGDDEASNEEETAGRWVSVCKLDDLVPGGPPQAFQVIADSWDAWNYYPPHPIGSVYVQLDKPGATPLVFTTTCPHLGCYVEYAAAKSCFKCPCHNSQFKLGGELITGVSPRPLDKLDAEVREMGSNVSREVWVRYERYQPGIHEMKAQ